MTLQRGYLELRADADRDGITESGVFELVGNLEVNQRMEVNHLFGNELGNVNSVVTSLPEWIPGQSGEDLASSRVSYFLDLGAGKHIFEINAIGWEDPSEPYLWGDPSEPSGSASNAGAVLDSDNNITRGSNTDSMQKMATLTRYLQYGEFDSRNESARLYFGEYYPDQGDRPEWMSSDLPDTPFDDYKHVTLRRNSINRNAQNPKSFDISVFLQETEDLTGTLDIVSQVDYL